MKVSTIETNGQPPVFNVQLDYDEAKHLVTAVMKLGEKEGLAVMLLFAAMPADIINQSMEEFYKTQEGQHKPEKVILPRLAIRLLQAEKNTKYHKTKDKDESND